jgi:hypothetical protein
MNNFKTTVLVLLTVLILLFGGLAIKIVFFPVNTVSKSVDTAYEVVKETMTGKNAIENYEWFKQQEAYIRQCVKNEQIAKEEYDNYILTLPIDRTTWDRLDKQEEASLRNSFYALQKLTNKAMEDYNARSSMENRAIFKDNLPSNITRAFYAGQDLTH